MSHRIGWKSKKEYVSVTVWKFYANCNEIYSLFRQMKPGVTRKKLNLMPQLSHLWKDVDRSGRKKSWTNQKQNLCFEVARESDSKARDLHANHLWLNFVTSYLCLRSWFERKLVCHFKERKIAVQCFDATMHSVSFPKYVKCGWRRTHEARRSPKIFRVSYEAHV